MEIVEKVREKKECRECFGYRKSFKVLSAFQVFKYNLKSFKAFCNKIPLHFQIHLCWQMLVFLQSFDYFECNLPQAASSQLLFKYVEIFTSGQLRYLVCCFSFR